MRINRLPTLRDRYSPAANSLGFLRLALALAVLVGHAWPLGLGEPNLGHALARGQTDLGTLAVGGFFVLSGFLVTAGARRLGPARFAWHRFLRIFPGLWVCLLVIALVFAPLVAVLTRGTASGLFESPDGPLQFVGQLVRRPAPVGHRRPAAGHAVRAAHAQQRLQRLAVEPRLRAALLRGPRRPHRRGRDPPGAVGDPAADGRRVPGHRARLRA